MTTESGLKDPFRAFRMFAFIQHTAELVRIFGPEDRYFKRTAIRTRDNARYLCCLAARDVGARHTDRQLLSTLKSHKNYLERCEAVAYATEQFKTACARSRRDHEDLIRVLGGGWADRMFPILDDGRHCQK